MATHSDTARIFQVEESPCCKGRVRVTLGTRKLCLDWREAKAAARALKQIGNRLRPPHHQHAKGAP